MAEEFERRSPVFDWERGDFARDPSGNVISVTETRAATEIIIKALQTARGRYLLYANLEDDDLHHKYGSDVPDITRDHTISRAVKEDEIKRSIRESLIYLDWVESVENIVFQQRTGELESVEVSCDVVTTFDEVITVEGVTINA